MKGVVILSAVLLSVAGLASAQSCVGVETRVNVRTATLTSAVTANIAAATATYQAQQILEQQQIMSALRVVGAQSDASKDQEVSTTVASAKALSQTIVEESTVSAITEAAEEFGHVGYNACDVTAVANDIATASQSASANGATISFGIMERYGSQDASEHQAQLEDWNNLALNGSSVTIEDVMTGDPVATDSFTRLILGPPVPPVSGNGVGSDLGRIQGMERKARQSAAAKVIADVSAEAVVREALLDFHDEYFGADGGEEWAASQAASPARGVLLDMARLEAVNLAATALQLRKSLREEFALSVYALSVVDDAVSNWQSE